MRACHVQHVRARAAAARIRITALLFALRTIGAASGPCAGWSPTECPARRVQSVTAFSILTPSGPAPRLRLQGTILHSNKGGLRPPAPSSALGSDAPSTPAPTTAPPSAATSLGGGGSFTSGSGSAGGGGGGGNSVPVSDFNVGLFLGQDDKPDRSPKKIFVTGATGSIGRCVVTQLLQDTQHTVVCLVRSPSHLRLPITVREQARTRLVLLIGNINDASVYAEAAGIADYAVLLACSWGGADCYAVNVDGTLKVINCLKPTAQVIYASSAGLLTATGQVSDAVLAARNGNLAALYWGGSEYLKSKAVALASITSIPSLQERLTVIYPILILGPCSRAPARRSVEEAVLPRLLLLSGLASSLSFIHPRDAAQVVTYLIERPRVGRCDTRKSYVQDQLGGSKVYKHVEEAAERGSGKHASLTARHFILGQNGATSLWVRCLGGGMGGGVGMVLGIAGAPLNNLVLAGWSAILWTAAGITGGSLSAQALPAALVSSMLGWSGVEGPPARNFPTAVSPETLGLTSYAPTVAQVLA